MRRVKNFKHLLVKVKDVVLCMGQVSFKIKNNANIVELYAFILKR